MASPVISANLDDSLPGVEAADSECLTDEEVLAFASGTLEASRHLQAHVHFDQCEVCQRLLSEAAHALATATTIPVLDGEMLSWHTTFQPGTLVGQRYLIRHFIARGGMGEVYEAFDRELQVRVALKTVTSTACDNAGAVRRLKAEVQLARRVSHPNVCRIYDFGTHVMHETGAQISFLTMEFVDGKTLGQRIRALGAVPVDEARALARELLSGLSAAHEAGVLHRDFKSDNVMLRDEVGGGCSPLILDFGLARALDDGSRGSSSSTPSLLGTFSYIAPEQLQGRPHTTASDVYSFGLVWFEMLTGQLPFESPSSPVGSALARLQGSAAAPSSKNPLVPSDLDALVLRCLRRSPKDRFHTAREVLDALDASEARTRSSSHRRKLLPLGIGALLGAVAGYVATLPSKQPITNRDAVVYRSIPASSTPSSEAAAPRPPVLPAPDVSARIPERAVEPPRKKLAALPPNRDSVSSKSQPTPKPAEPSPSPPSPETASWEDPFDAGPPNGQAADGGS